MAPPEEAPAAVVLGALPIAEYGESELHETRLAAPLGRLAAESPSDEKRAREKEPGDERQPPRVPIQLQAPVDDLASTHTAGSHATFALPVDQDGKALKLNVLSFAQPHMRALWWETIAFFVCFNAWFAIPAMATTIKADLGFTNAQMTDANSVGVAGTIVARLLVGVVCDKFGPRYGQGAVLLAGALPTALAGLVVAYPSYVVVRLFISFIGAAFVPTQYHMSFMFGRGVVGEANALSAGWGNMGGGTTQLLMPLLMRSFERLGYTPHMQWRLAMIIPGVLAAAAGAAVVLFTRDLPQGNYGELERRGLRKKADTRAALAASVRDPATWIFALNYAACFGVELTIDSKFAEFYADHFAMDKLEAGAAASAFGLMNIFSRWSGGRLSDAAARRWGMRGRLWLMFGGLVLEGVFLVIFSRMENIVASFFFMIVFSYWCQMSCGTTFGCVPYLNPAGLGAAAGIIGAGGNAGAIATLQLFKPLYYTDAFSVLGCIVFAVPFSLVFVKFPALGGASLWHSGSFSPPPPAAAAAAAAAVAPEPAKGEGVTPGDAQC